MFDMTPEDQEVVATPFEAMDDRTLHLAEIRTERAVCNTDGTDADAKADLRAIRLEMLARALERNDEAGFQFDMMIGLELVSPRTAGYDLLTRGWTSEEAPHRCGTAGCIAGMAYSLWFGHQPEAVRKELLEDTYSALDWEKKENAEETPELSWAPIRQTAAGWLGLTRDSDLSPRWSDPFVVWYGPKLFDPEIPRPNGRKSGAASATQAAEACRRVARGQEPWDF